jgi:hypothetical protein
MLLAPGAFAATAGIGVNTSCRLSRYTAAPGCVLGLWAPEGLPRESGGFLVPGGPGVGCSADRGIKRCLLRGWIPPGTGVSVWVWEGVMGSSWPTPFAEQRTCDRGRPIVLWCGTHIFLRCDTHELVFDTLSAVVFSTLDMIRT